MAWIRYVCGRIKSDYRYSKDIVCNNFPFPEAVSEKQQAKVEEKAQAVLSARELFPNATLANLYDPISMPRELLKAHRELDEAVDATYRRAPDPPDNQNPKTFPQTNQLNHAPDLCTWYPQKRISVSAVHY
ncbi:MAG: hypothetical protein NT163_05920 [Chlorobiales bacterium]|nr:hypothetical protein [Chlorobiales bacterium]